VTSFFRLAVGRVELPPLRSAGRRESNWLPQLDDNPEAVITSPALGLLLLDSPT
jgi:hypothetical protein